MATSSSDGSCTAPADFQLSSDLEDVTSRLSLNLLKCPLCHNSRRIFYCRQCIQNGDFVHSTSVYSERFADKQLRLLRLKASRAQLEEKCANALERLRQKDKMICDISMCKERVRLLQILINETKQNIHRGHQRLNVLKDVNSQLVLRLPRHEERVEKLYKFVEGLKVVQVQKTDAVEKKRLKLKKLIRAAAKQLTEYIFPLKVVPTRSPRNSEDENLSSDNVTCALADASGTSYVRGRWISDAEKSLEIQLRIVASTLPSSGDYSAYSRWVAAAQETPGPYMGNPSANQAYNISAALTYATQLVNMIAYYVDVRLPFKISCSEFCENEMSSRKFARKVAMLNSNVLHLCYNQNTNVAVLHPLHTLQNIMHLLNTNVSDFGRVGPMEQDPAIFEKMYSLLERDLEVKAGSIADEDTDPINCEWEAVPNIPCPEMTVPHPDGTGNSQTSSIKVNQSVAGGLVSSAAASIASIWRGWTTNR